MLLPTSSRSPLAGSIKELEAGSKSSTWFPPGRLVEQESKRSFCSKSNSRNDREEVGRSIPLCSLLPAGNTGQSSVDGAVTTELFIRRGQKF